MDDNSQAVLVEADPFVQFFSQTEGCGMTREFRALSGWEITAATAQQPVVRKRGVGSDTMAVISIPSVSTRTFKNTNEYAYLCFDHAAA